MAVKAKAEITISKIIDISKSIRYYLLQSSTLAAPSKPKDGAAIGSNWSKTEPSYTSGSTSTLYFVDQTVMSDGTLKYSEVSKSSSYEAAKEAWNKANNAQKTASDANDKIDGLRVGGRNMLRGSSFDNQPNIDNTYTKYKNNSVKLTVDNTNGTAGTTKYVSISSLTQSWNLSDVIDKTITISLWIYIEKLQQVNGYEFRVIYTHDGVTKYFSPDTKYPYYVPSGAGLKVGWNYVYASFTIPSDSTRADFNFTLYAKAGKTSTAWFSSPKAEIGNKATDWTPAPEDAMANTYQEYYLSTSQTALSGGSWSTTAPTWVNGKYMWSRTVKVDGAGNKTYTPNQNGVCIAGAKGDTGSTGRGISSSTITYQLSDSPTKRPTGTWLTSPPTTDIAKPYLWTKIVFNYTNGTVSDPAYSVSSTFDSLMIGGRNLIPKSNRFPVNYTYPTSGYKDCKSAVTTVKLNGDTYILSFWAKSTVEGDKIRVNFYNPSNILTVKGSQGQVSQSSKDGSCNFTLTTTLTKYWVTYTIPKGGNSTRSVIVPKLMAGAGTGTVTVQWEKLEEGNVATDWTPAPEDLESRVRSAETNISNNSKEIKLKASQTEVTQISKDLKTYTESTTEFIQNTKGWQMNWNKLISTDEADVANHTDYITFTNGDIILGESASDLKLKITNDSIQFKGTSDSEVKPDADATAWITGSTFHINNGEIQDSLKVGKLKFIPRSNGNFAITIV